ncbi:hypothetical protein KSF_017160 [Reticulibacter mediterranei]|uniref:PatA-like N-terminal domain-containing protein n=1 Tax=Reticulibacter mediterranei TaxID=2778369 RepID=A0A8J3IDS4_9CHLR|nr:DUF4388 domain-containing protein [Reticulibacter mediterranei]GHO91668.1 hypothetical protein KSF_017160 [Reticulibacter mediterranei]
MKLGSSKSLPRVARLNYFSTVTLALLEIHERVYTGRLSIRNNERVGLVHLYFKERRLVHVAGYKRDAEAVLHDLLTWTKGRVRFDPAVTVDYEDVSWQQAEIFTRWVTLLEMHSLAYGISRNQLCILTQHLAMYLPQKPIALPPAVEPHEKLSVSGEEAQGSEEHASPIQQVGEAILYVSRLTQELTRRAAKVTHQRARQAVEFMHDTARYAAVRTEGNSAETPTKEQPPQSLPPCVFPEQSTETIVEQTTQNMTALPLPTTSLSSLPESGEESE